MLAKRIIPCLDVKDGRVVKGTSFVKLRDAGDPVECGAAYSDAGADELVFLDITATIEARDTLRDLVSKVAERISIPFTVGGGIRSIEDIHALLKAGADKISINTAAVRGPALVSAAAADFGCQCIVVAIDAKRSGSGRSSGEFTSGESGDVAGGIRGGPVPGKPPTGGSWRVHVEAGRTPTELDAVEWAREAAERGAGEILLTSIDADGHRAGYDVELTAAVAEAVSVPVIASGGAGGPDDIHRVLTEGRADAALAASIFHYGKYSIGEVKQFLRARGVHVRL